MRSKGSLKPSLPCLDDPVTKLEGLGEKTRRNLLDVRACVATLDLAGSIPQDCPNAVTSGMCAVLCCAVLCCAVLCCAVLCCAVLCCAVLCCAVSFALAALPPLMPAVPISNMC